MNNSIDFSEDFHGKKKTSKSGDFGATYVYEFSRGGGKPPVTVYWYEGGHLPELPEAAKSISKIDGGGGMLIGDKNTIISPGMRPTSPRLLNNWMELRRELPPKTIPRAVGGPVAEIIAAIKGDIEKCGSNFDYAVPLTEVVILGTIATRSNKRVEYIPESMTFKDASLNKYVKDPVRAGWEYGRTI